MKRPRATQVSPKTSSAAQILQAESVRSTNQIHRSITKRPRTKTSRKTSSSAAAEILGSIDDLLIQVFLRLPVKQVCRFKLVSKHWNSIFSDPKLHLSLRNPEPAVGLIFRCRYDFCSPWKSNVLSFNQPANPKPMGETFGDGAKVLHSCNGLLLCEYFSRHFIYNPMTKKSSTLDPGTGDEYFSGSILGMYLAFDPSESCHYKLVCVVGLSDPIDDPDPFSDEIFKFEVYSSETGSWRRCGEPFSATVDFEAGVYWKGAIHWVSLIKSGKSIYFNPSCGDENDQMLPSVMPSPPRVEDSYKERNYHFGESCGHLNFVDAYSSKGFDEFNVYEMKTDYSGWFVKYRVDLSNVFVKHCEFSVCTLVRGNKDDEDSFLVLREGKRFIRFSLVDMTFETIFECKVEQTEFENEEFPHQYIEGAFGNVDGVWATETETRSCSL